MTSDEMARDYLRRAKARRQALNTLLSAGAYADVVRESQDVAELVIKGALRFVGVDPPKRHDPHIDDLRPSLDRLAEERGPAAGGASGGKRARDGRRDTEAPS